MAMRAQASPQPNSAGACPPSTTLDEMVKALDDAVSGPGNKDRTCMRELMLPAARLSPIAKAADGSFEPHLLTVDDWITTVAKRGSAEFYERQIKFEKQEYGHIAHLWSHYEIRPTPDGAATVHGVNSIQAVFDGSKWKVLSVNWEAETTAGTAGENARP